MPSHDRSPTTIAASTPVQLVLVHATALPDWERVILLRVWSERRVTRGEDVRRMTGAGSPVNDSAEATITGAIKSRVRAGPGRQRRNERVANGWPKTLPRNRIGGKE